MAAMRIDFLSRRLPGFFAPSFEDFCEQWLKQEYARKAPASLHQTQQLLQNRVYPYIGNKRVNKVRYEDIVAIITRYRVTAPRSARKLAQMLRRIFVYADAMLAYRINNPVRAGIKLFCDTDGGGEFAALMPSELPKFFKRVGKVKERNPQVRIAFWLLAYTALRRSEVMRAEWAEISFECAEWAIPAARMKMRHDHIVPLSPPVLALLQQLQRKTKRRSGKLFDIEVSAPLNLSHAAGYHNRMTLHGLRKVFSTHAHESGLWSIDAIELHLAHIVQGVRGVYNKAQHLDERRRLMAWYAAEVDKWRGIDNSRYNGAKEQNTT